jgi:hypothetical protein
LASCSVSGSGNYSLVDPDRVIPVCSFPKIAASRVGTKIRVRGRLTLHAHGIFLSDERCPKTRVDLHIAADGPDLCGPELVQQFGCPPAAGEPIVTAVGVLRREGVLVFDQLVDFEKAPVTESR